jgi:hypothetical protein
MNSANAENLLCKHQQVPSYTEAAAAWDREQASRTVISQGFTLSPLSAQDILSLPDTPIKWVWQDYIAEGDVAIVAAYPKIGKSTFFYPLALSVARGAAFLERATSKGGVLVLAIEEHQRDINKRLQKLGLQSTDLISVHYGMVPNTSAGRQEIRRVVREKKIALVFIDSLAAFWNIKSEIDNAEIQSKLDPLREIARDENVAICLIHHESKSGGRDSKGNHTGDGKSIRGGGGILGAVDQAITLSKAPGNTPKRRVLSTVGRRSESPRELTIELWGETALSNPEPYGFNVVGTAEQITKQGIQDAVKEILTDEWQPIKGILKESVQSNDATRKALEGLFAAGKAERSGTGKKGDGFRYRLPQPALASENSQTESVGNGKANSFRLIGLPNPIVSNTTNLTAELTIEPKAGDGKSFRLKSPSMGAGRKRIRTRCSGSRVRQGVGFGEWVSVAPSEGEEK